MKTFCFVIKPGYTADDGWLELESKGLSLLYSDEDENQTFVYAQATTQPDPSHFKCVQAIMRCQLPEIDWQKQWETHGIDYRDGCINLNLEKYQAASIRLAPGPGFGDFSHPTTRLTLDMFAGYVKGRHLIDVGSGSGVLAIAAARIGAASVHGIDVDPEAIKHARANAELNQVQVHFSLPGDLQFATGKQEFLIAMNMIMAEQMEAWRSLAPLHFKIKEVVTSGILVEQEKQYLSVVEKWGWTLIETRVEADWSSYRFAC